MIARRPDVVHLNCGLHDLKKAFGAAEPEVPLARYGANLRAIFRRARQETAAKLIWATTTPVNETWHHERKGFDRFEADVRAYNAESLRAAEEEGVRVNNLFDAIVRVGRDGFSPVAFGDLPPVVAGFVERWTRVFTMTADACFAKDRQMALQALRLDPVCSHLNGPQVQRLADELMRAHKPFLKGWR